MTHSWLHIRRNYGTETGEDIFDNEPRYGLNPTTATGNGIFFIDNNKGLIYFSSNLAGKIVWTSEKDSPKETRDWYIFNSKNWSVMTR